MRVALGHERALGRIAAGQRLAARATELAAMEYEFLYDRTRHLLAIGYNVDQSRRDSRVYDLVASEAFH